MTTALTTARREVDHYREAETLIAAYGERGAVVELLRRLTAEQAGTHSIEYAVRFPADRYGPERVECVRGAVDRAHVAGVVARARSRGVTAELVARAVRRGPWEAAA